MNNKLDNQLNKLNPIKIIYISVIVPILAIFTALIISSVVIILSGSNPLIAYSALAEGAFGNLNNWIETILKTTPLIIGGLGVALAFRGGLFNIGVEGQIFVGSIATVIIGTTLKAPAIIHIPLTLLAGVLAGAVWAAIPGYLKARFGAHEVITTIMTNYIATRIITWSIGVNGPLRKTTSFVPETNSLLDTARLPLMISDTRLHIGIVIALILAIVVYILLFRTTLGIEIRTVGLNINAAKYCGIKVNRNIVLIMAISGGLAGLAGAIQVMGLSPYNFTAGFNVGYGFDSLAVAVLGNINPIGVVFSAFLFGAMDAGARLMQLRAKVPVDMITILQGLILMFVAANQIIRGIYRIQIQDKKADKVNLSQGWGGGSK
ncbi:MAG: ABC transporter permease [Chloroflexi bacterium HGW-Chloroflexi-3]|nr:MAG: ABC transporter permease [Chloroflexi bacterium HGW-Chloroflexi-3]